MSKYIPPSLKRNLEENKQQEKKVPSYEEDFPALVNVAPSVKVWGGNKSFTTMVGEFKEKHELEKGKQQIEQTSRIKFQKSLPYITNVHNFIEPEDVEDDYIQPEPKRQKTEEDDEGWIKVDHRKYRKQKSIEEIANRPPTPPEENEETVWDDLEEHQKCWDDKNH